MGIRLEAETGRRKRRLPTADRDPDQTRCAMQIDRSTSGPLAQRDAQERRLQQRRPGRASGVDCQRDSSAPREVERHDKWKRTGKKHFWAAPESERAVKCLFAFWSVGLSKRITPIGDQRSAVLTVPDGGRTGCQTRSDYCFCLFLMKYLPGEVDCWRTYPLWGRYLPPTKRGSLFLGVAVPSHIRYALVSRSFPGPMLFTKAKKKAKDGLDATSLSWPYGLAAR